MPADFDVPSPSKPARERLLTPALGAFLLLVALAVGAGLWPQLVRRDLDQVVLLLADGDLDGDERRRALQDLVDRAPEAAGLRQQWAVLLAAVALGDAAGYAAARVALGPAEAPAPLPSPGERELLHLGSGLLRNVLAGFAAEADGDRAEARRRWAQVAAQSRLAAQPFPGELAAEGLRRNP